MLVRLPAGAQQQLRQVDLCVLAYACHCLADTAYSTRFIKQEGHGPAICPGEWGGWAKEGGKDAAWQMKLADWFVENGITDSFYWCLNPNSGDTVCLAEQLLVAIVAL
jgi:hypothetical protein